MDSVLNKAGTKLFQKHLKQYEPADPLYENYVDNRGKQKRRKRQLPPGLSARDAKILKSVQRRAHYLDKGFSACGVRFGWTFIIGLIPGAGDVADIGLNYFLVVRKARQAELPNWLIQRMLLNNFVSAAAGFIPIAGDIILAAYKANSRNAALLEEFLRIRGEEFLRLQSEGKDVSHDGAVIKGNNKSKGGKVVQEDAKGEVAKGVQMANLEHTRPGAGRGEGEVVEGTGQAALIGPESKSKKGLMSWASGKDKGKGKESIVVGERGRFIEDVPSGGSSGIAMEKK